MRRRCELMAEECYLERDLALAEEYKKYLKIIKIKIKLYIVRRKLYAIKKEK